MGDVCSLAAGKLCDTHDLGLVRACLCNTQETYWLRYEDLTHLVLMLQHMTVHDVIIKG